MANEAAGAMPSMQQHHSTNRSELRNRTSLEIVVAALQSVLSLGEHLRDVYAGATNAELRSADLAKTTTRAAIFAAWCALVAAVEIKRCLRSS